MLTKTEKLAHAEFALRGVTKVCSLLTCFTRKSVGFKFFAVTEDGCGIRDVSRYIAFISNRKILNLGSSSEAVALTAPCWATSRHTLEMELITHGIEDVAMESLIASKPAK